MLIIIFQLVNLVHLKFFLSTSLSLFLVAFSFTSRRNWILITLWVSPLFFLHHKKKIMNFVCMFNTIIYYLKCCLPPFSGILKLRPKHTQGMLFVYRYSFYSLCLHLCASFYQTPPQLQCFLFPLKNLFLSVLVTGF